MANELRDVQAVFRKSCPEHVAMSGARSALSVLVALALSVSLARADAASSWEVVLAPYLLLPSIDGQTTIGRVGGDVSVDPGGIFSSLQFGGMFHAEAHHKSGVGVMADAAFMFLGDGASGRRGVGRVNADVFQGIFEIYGAYRFDLGQTKLDAYGGARIWDIDTDIDVRAGPLSGEFEGGDTWVDPVLGLRVQQRIASSWRLQVQSDIGGFGVGGSSDFSWNVMGGLAYDGWESTSVFLLYRALSVDFDSGTPGTASFFEYDAITHGPLIGVAVRF